MILRADEIKKLVRDELNVGRKAISFFASDSTYQTVKKTYWSGSFYSWYRRQLSKLSCFNWMNKHDCDNKAGLFMQFAQIPHSKSKSDSAEGVPVGEFWYQTDDAGGHAINIIITSHKDEPQVLFFEPQDGTWVELSAAEKKSVMLVKF